MATDVVAQLQAELTDQPVNPLRPAQVEELRIELDRLEALCGPLGPKDQDGRHQSWIRRPTGEAGKRMGQIRKMLADQAPKPITGERQDRVARLASEVVERIIRPALMPQSEQRRGGSALVIDHVRGVEWSKRVKDATLAWKRAMRGLDPTHDGPNYTNIEQFRPRGLHPDGVATFSANAAIPGNFAMTPQAKANWPVGLTEPQNTALKQAERAANGSAKKPLSPKQRAALDRMHAARRAKRAAAPQDANPGEPLAAEG